ncbi:MAG TPA: hypothetical protein VHV49_00625 [Pseudonocardiaceae bacterium]|jgi:hypothetical protein|nr:hypothetical protein [Pseudonocardiaceae bacterium]
MSITKAQLEELIGDYQHARRQISAAADTLQDVTDAIPAVAEITGQHGPTAPSSIISTIGDVIGALFRAEMTLTEAHARAE